MCCFDVRKMNRNYKDIFEKVIANLRLRLKNLQKLRDLKAKNKITT